MASNYIPMEEVRRHKDATWPPSTWLLIHGSVYDVTDFLHEHPGGAQILLDCVGRDATQAFEDVGHSEEARERMLRFKIGEIDPVEKAKIVYITKRNSSKINVRPEKRTIEAPNVQVIHPIGEAKKDKFGEDIKKKAENITKVAKKIKIAELKHQIEKKADNLKEDIKNRASKCPMRCPDSPAPDEEPSTRASKCPMRCPDSPAPDEEPSTRASKCPMRCPDSPAPDEEPSTRASKCPMGCPDSPAPDEEPSTSNLIRLGLIALLAAFVIGFAIKKMR